MVTLEELEAKLDRFIANSDETARDNLRKSYEAFKNKTPAKPPVIVEPDKPVKTVDPLQKGISGLMGFEVKTIEPNNNSGQKAFDRKRSTAFEGKSLTAGIGGVGLIKGIGVKFKGGPYTYKIESSFDNKIWAEVPVLANTFKENEFDVFEFAGTPLIAQYIKISSDKKLSITSLELLGEVKGTPEIPVPKPEEPKPEPGEPTPAPQPGEAGLDQFGITMMSPSPPNGKLITEMGYKRSSHNTGTRDTFSKKGADFMAMEVTGYYKTSLSDNEEELSYKIYGGTHSDSAPKQGQCMSFGMEQVGTPSFKKEWPQHPDTPDFSNDVTIAEGMEKKQKSFKGRWIGLKGQAWINKDEKKAYFKMYLDDVGMVANKPANDWKLWYEYYDDGKNLEGPAFMENMGVKNGGDALFYMRIDTVTDKTDTYGLSCREIVPPTS